MNPKHTVIFFKGLISFLFIVSSKKYMILSLMDIDWDTDWNPDSKEDLLEVPSSFGDGYGGTYSGFIIYCDWITLFIAIGKKIILGVVKTEVSKMSI